MNMTPSSLETASADNMVVPSTLTSYRLIREARAPKMGLRSTGQIVFQVLTDDAHQDVFLRIAANEGGGYVSDEAVSVHALARCITDLEAGQILRSGMFKPAFAGRSSNNSGFIAAVMLAEGLLSRDAERPHLLIDNGLWNEWRATQLAVSGDLPTVRVGKEIDSSVNNTPAVGSGADPDDEVPTDSDTAKPGRKARKGRAVDPV